MQETIIYGCGNLGKFAYEFLKSQYKILFFVDKNAKKINEYGGLIYMNRCNCCMA